MKGLTLFSIVLSVFASISAQTFPRWSQPTNIQIYLLNGAFTETEQRRIEIAIESWRPLLPEGFSIKIVGETTFTRDCQGCATMNRSTLKASEWGECEVHLFKDAAWFSIIRIDPRAGSGDAMQRIVEHEIGHALGLDHRSKSVMSARAHGAPSKEDGAVLRAIYGDPPSTGVMRAVAIGRGSFAAGREPVEGTAQSFHPIQQGSSEYVPKAVVLVPRDID